MKAEALIQVLESWAEHGWFRYVDLALARFLWRQAPETSAETLLAAALTGHQLGKGHICLDFRSVLADPDAELSLPPEGASGGADLPPASKLLAGLSFQEWEDHLRHSSLITDADLITGVADDTPLVFSAGRLYLRRYWQYMQQIAQGIVERLSQTFPLPEDMPARLDRLFSGLRTPAEQDKREVHWQSIAAAVAAGGAFTVISGGPGTGKTTTVVQLLTLLQELAQEQGGHLRIQLAAPTGKAAARLTASMGNALGGLPASIQRHIPAAAVTLHRLLGSRPDSRRFVHNAQNLLHVDMLVVDEASMIGIEIMAALLEALPASARLILLGDKDQLASVEAGSVLGDICRNASHSAYPPDFTAWVERYTGYRLQPSHEGCSSLDPHIVLLRRSHRFGEQSGIGALSHAVNEEDTSSVAAIWDQEWEDIGRLDIRSPNAPEFAHLVLDGRVALKQLPVVDAPSGYRRYLQYVKEGRLPGVSEDVWITSVLDAFDAFQVLAAVRKGRWGVEGLNEKIADILFKAGLIPASAGWYAGRPVMVTRNDYSIGLMNGDIGIALRVSDGPDENADVLRVVFPTPDRVIKKVRPSRLNDVETVFAMTVHKSQGSEFTHTVLVLPDVMSPALTRELLYTGITRARRWFTLVSPRRELLAESIIHHTRRASGLGDLLEERAQYQL